MDKMIGNIKKYYSSKKLSDEKVDLLLSRRRSHNLIGTFGKLAIAALLILGFIFTITQFQGTGIEDRIVKEIAMNHSKELNIEFPTNDLNSLQAKLDKLDFPLAKADGFIKENYELMGGRYCSIQGNLAAQLKIKNKATNNIDTLYITNLNNELSDVKPTSVNVEGVNIEVWHENGLLYGKASDVLY